MTTERSMLEMLALLKSAKKRDRTSGLVNAGVLVQQERVQNYLSENSRSGAALCWDSLFSYVHAAVTSEASTKMTAKLTKEVAELLTCLLEKSRGLIKASTLASAVVTVLDLPELDMVVVKCYLDIAIGHLLQRPSYRAHLGPGYWSELVDICKRKYELSPNAGQTNLRYLELMCKAVTGGVQHSLCVLDLDLLPFLTDVLTSPLPPSAQFLCLELVNTCVTALAADARYQVAAFVEAVLPSIMERYRTGWDANTQIFKFLVTSINIHHPNGAGWDDEMCYAADWTKWKSQLSEMVSLCEQEGAHVLRSGRDHAPPSQYLFQLMADLSVLGGYERDESRDERSFAARPIHPSLKRKSLDAPLTQTQKRAKMVRITDNLTHILTDMTAKDQWFWLGWLELLMDRHPSTIEKDYESLVLLVSDLLCHVSSAPALGHLSRCAVKLLNRYSDDRSSPESRKVIQEAWEKTYESLLRSVGKSNLPEYHLVLQKIIHKSVMRDYSDLLKLILEGSCPASQASIRTVNELVNANSIKTEGERRLLMTWLLKEVMNPAETAQLALSLAAKQCNPFKCSNISPDEHNTLNEMNFQYVYPLIALKAECYPKRSDCQSSHSNVTTNEPRTSFDSVLLILADALSSSLRTTAHKLEVNNFTREILEEVAAILRFILLTLSMIWELLSEHIRVSLVTSLGCLFFDVTSALAGSPESFEPLTYIFSLELHPELLRLTRDPSWTSQELVRKALNVLQDNWHRPKITESHHLTVQAGQHYKSPFSKLACNFILQSDCDKLFSRDMFTKRGTAHLFEAAEFLGQFVLGSVGHQMPSVQTSLIDFISMAADETPSTTQIQLIIRTVHAVLYSSAPPNQLAKCFDVIEKVCQAKPSDTTLHTVILMILNDSLPRIALRMDEESRETFLSLLMGFGKVLKDREQKTLGMVISYLKLLVTTCDYPELAILQWEESGDVIVTDIVRYTTHPGVQVRALASLAISKLFQACCKIQLDQTVLDMLESQLRVWLRERDSGYERLARTGTALIALAQAFVSAPSLSIQIAYLMLKIVKIKECDSMVTENLIKWMSHVLDVKDSSRYFQMHLKELLMKWLQDGIALNMFPYQLVGCSSQNQFYKQHLRVIGAACFLLKKMDMLKEVACVTNLPLNQVLEESYPILIAAASYALLEDLQQYIPPEKDQEVKETRLDECIFAVLKESKPPSNSFLRHAFKIGSVVQKTLLLLEEGVMASVTDEDRKCEFLRYKSLVEKYVSGVAEVSPSDSGSSGGSYYESTPYVLRDAVAVVLRLFSVKHTPELISLCCQLLQNVVHSCLNTISAEIELILPGMVNALVSLASTENSSSALALLKYLLVDCHSKLSNAIARLDPFPEETRFAGLIVAEHLSLRNEIERMTDMAGYKGRRVGGLTRLLLVLENKKNELVQMHSQARKTNDGQLLHDVLAQLLELCAHRDPVVRLEAGKCLGELGPSHLTMLVARTEESENGVVQAELRMVDSVMLILKQLIETEDIEVKRSACDALRALMHCQGSDSQCSGFYAPFVPDNLSPLNVHAMTDTAPPMTVWVPGCTTSHDAWVRGLTTGLLEVLVDGMGVLELLKRVCLLHPPTSHLLLPHVLELTTTVGTAALCSDIADRIKKFLEAFIEGTSGLSFKSIRCLLDAFDYIRRWRYRSRNYEAVLNVDSLLVSEAASLCGAHFLSMLYAELWFQERKTADYQMNPSRWSFSLDDVERGQDVSRLMRSSFVNVGCTDGLLGCGTGHLSDWKQRTVHLQQIGRWDLSLVVHDVMRNEQGVVHSLAHNGLVHTMTRLPSTDPDVLTSCATQLADWTHVPSSEQPPSFSFHQFSALKALHEQDHSIALTEIDKATNIVLEQLSDSKVESSRELQRSLARLLSLKQLRDIVGVKSADDVDHLREKWLLQDKLESADFSLMEEVLTVRSVAVKEQSIVSQSLKWKEILGDLYLKFCKLARAAKKNHLVLRNAVKVAEIKDIPCRLLAKARVEEAQYFWAEGERRTATVLLSNLLSSLEGTEEKELLAKCLRLYGNWMVETKAENPRDIICKYFEKSEVLAKEKDNLLETYASMAKFADMHYIQCKEYIESTDFSLRRENMLKGQNLQPEGAGQTRQRLTEAKLDAAEINDLTNDFELFALTAVKYYSLSLELGDKYDYFVFRLVSLWLNCPTEVCLGVHRLLTMYLPKIPPHKFITLLPQIVPRMYEDPLLEKVVWRALERHPHHTLPIVFALKNAHADQDYQGTGQRAPPTERITAAEVMLRKAQANTGIQPLVFEMEHLTEALIHIANLEAKSAGGPVMIPQDFPIVRLLNLESVLMPTFNLPVQTNSNYVNIVGVHKFSSSFELVGGINAPKKMECIGTDGKKRTILVKGKDDPRLDAVMQQVFGVINEVLARDEAAARRQLEMRTYRVVPLSQRSGIIQWCDNTQPLGLYLAGSSTVAGAHQRFRPGDIKPREARLLMQDLAKRENKLELFQNICARIKPVMHYFFLEKFPSAGVTFEKRLNYTRSVATSSMIGYVLGLGDRHVQNILIDNTSGEVVHIDFGIAFEQGKTLNTPETVPFRLTRDIVDGMGMCGVDGVFRASCEATIAVLRQHKDIVITLLEVLLYDPLYSWDRANPQRTNSSPQTTEAEPEVNVSAERALLRVTSKLQGLDGGGGVVSTIEGQVNGLLQQAQDPYNLCRLFNGWQPYL